MKFNHRFWSYWALAGIIISTGAIIYGIVTGETLLLPKCLLALGISIYFFRKERKAKQEAEMQEIQLKVLAAWMQEQLGAPITSIEIASEQEMQELRALAQQSNAPTDSERDEETNLGQKVRKGGIVPF